MSEAFARTSGESTMVRTRKPFFVVLSLAAVLFASELASVGVATLRPC